MTEEEALQCQRERNGEDILEQPLLDGQERDDETPYQPPHPPDPPVKRNDYPIHASAGRSTISVTTSNGY